MQSEYPYQIVTFLGKEPHLNEPVYYGENGWYPQLALKRRFKLLGIDESQLVQILQPFLNGEENTEIITGSIVKPERMPVKVIDIENQVPLKSIHKNLLIRLNGDIASRYPDREGDNYYAHITAEFNNEFVIPVDEYVHKTFKLNNIWILKDTVDENSVAYRKLM